MIEARLDRMKITLEPKPKARAVLLMCKILWDARNNKANPDLDSYLNLFLR